VKATCFAQHEVKDSDLSIMHTKENSKLFGGVAFFSVYLEMNECE
jgi:hypothetical protein